MERHPEAKHQTTLTVSRLIKLLSGLSPATVVCGRIVNSTFLWPLSEDEIWLEPEKDIVIIGD